MMVRLARITIAAALAMASATGTAACKTQKELPREAGTTTTAPDAPPADAGEAGDTGAGRRLRKGLVLPDGVDLAEVDLPASQLVPEVVGNQNVRLAQEAARNANFCLGWGAVTRIEEPKPYKLSDLVRHAGALYGVANQIDPELQVPNANAGPGEPRRVDLPAEVKEALAIAQKEMYAYFARLQFTQELEREDLLSRAQVRRRIDLAFLHLAAERYSQANATLEEYYTRDCLAGGAPPSDDDAPEV